MGGGVGQGLAPQAMPIAHSESNPLLGGPPINDRVKLAQLNHIPSVKSNLMNVQNQSDNMSQGNLDSVNRVGINYEAMPIGKKSVLAPINVMNGQMNESAGHPVLSKMSLDHSTNGSHLVNRKNNRTLKPL